MTCLPEVPTVEHLVTSCHLGDVTHSIVHHVFVAPFPCRLASARLVTRSAVPEESESSGSWWRVALHRHRRHDGVGEPERSELVAKSTGADTGEAITANVAWHFDVCAWDGDARFLATNDVVSLSLDRTGSSPPLRGMLVVLRYEPT